MDKTMNELRPDGFDTYIGQKSVRENLKVCVDKQMSNRRANKSSVLDHVLLCGPAGTGKTSLAIVIADALGKEIKAELMGPRITDVADLDFMEDLEHGDIVFIDEVHALPTRVEELLYEAMEDYKWNGKSIPKFTLIGATTKEGFLSKPLHDRFTIVETLELYSAEDLSQIVKRSASILGLKMSAEAEMEVAKRSRGTPRLANQFLKRIANYAVNDEVSVDIARTALDKIGIDGLGLDRVDLELLRVMHTTFKDGPVGLDAVAGVLDVDTTSIELVREPYLLKVGFLSRGSKGRMLTSRGISYLTTGKVV